MNKKIIIVVVLLVLAYLGWRFHKYKKNLDENPTGAKPFSLF
jgi:predicted negative regulator of RcsB-dependent stress response